ncbi:MAG TPA: OAM dimerization domain-containing protein [Solirubrobacterales bacterium]
MSSRDRDMTAVRPYGDHYDDGLIELSFTLPVPSRRSARKAATMLAEAMGLEAPEVAHCEELTEGFTFFVLYGRCPHSVDFTAIDDAEWEPVPLSEPEIEEFAAEHLTRKVVVVGASVGTDTHTVGIDAILNLKGFDGSHGLEAYGAFETHNLGGQVSNEALVRTVLELEADALLVSQTVTQQELHVGTLRDLVERIEASGRRGEMLLICGGPRITNDLARELGFDVGFSKGTYPHHVASYIVRETAARAASETETTSAAL